MYTHEDQKTFCCTLDNRKNTVAGTHTGKKVKMFRKFNQRRQYTDTQFPGKPISTSITEPRNLT